MSMHAQTERHSNIGWVIGGLALFGLPWWLPDLAIPICLGVAIGAFALIAGRVQIAETDGWPRAGVILACGGLGILGGGSWQIAPIIALITLFVLAGAALASGKRGMGTTDRLTGLLNQRAFNVRADEELSRGLRFGRPVTLAIITVEDAAALREKHGRRALNLALGRVADALRGQSRSYDLLACLDGQRFAILLPETTRDEAVKVTGRISAALAASPLVLPEEERAIVLGVTITLTEYPTEGETLQPLLACVQPVGGAARYGVLARMATHLTTVRLRRRQTATIARTDMMVRAFITAVWLAALVLFVATFTPIPQSLWASLILMIGIGIISRSVRVSLYGLGSISNHFVVIMAGIILLGPTGAMILAAIAGIICWPWRGQARTYIFDGGSYALIAGLLGLLEPFLIEHFPVGSWFNLPLIGHGLVLGAICYVLNAGLTIAIMSISSHYNPYTLWRERFVWFIPYTLTFGVLAVFMAQAGTAFGPVGLLIFAAPAFMILLATKQYLDQTRASVTALNEAHQRLSTLNQQLSDSVEELQQSYTATLEAFSGMLDARDSETEGHSKRVVRCAVAIGKAMGISDEEMASLEVGALLHDIGKVGVSDQILRKNGPLTPDEWLEMRKHPEIGYGLTSRISFLDHASPIVRHHHERWDGTGYPDGLCGENIPLAARIFAVADSFDAMISDRPYRRGLPLEQIIGELKRGTGKQFDPQVVNIFISLIMDDAWLASIREARADNTVSLGQIKIPAHR
jgi:diguanylate cyclase (GGDEF)-like protein